MDLDDRSAEHEFREYRRTRDLDLRNALVEHFWYLAVSNARRFLYRGEPFDDLVQVAGLALIGAVERYDPDYGTSFAQFAGPTILGAVRRYFRDASWVLKAPRTAKDLYQPIRDASDELSQSLKRSPTPAEVADHLDIGIDDVLQALDAGRAYRVSSISPGGEGDEDLGSTGRFNEPGQDDVDLEEVPNRVMVRRMLRDLSHRDREIVVMRYFSDMTQEEIAERTGLSQVHVSRLLRKVQECMKGSLTELDQEQDVSGP